MIDQGIIDALYIIASILFIYGLKMLGNQKTARKEVDFWTYRRTSK